MIRFVNGNLFASKAQTLINTVNCVGIMGKGVALAFKKKYPEMYKDYRSQCEMGKIQPGILTIYKETQPWVLNFPTKWHWKSRSRLDDIDLGLREFVRHYQEWGVTSVAMPALGCGHGGLDWADVKPMIEKHLGNLDIEVEVYEPGSEFDIANDSPPANDEQGLMRDLFGNLVEPPGVKQKPKKRKEKTNL